MSTKSKRKANTYGVLVGGKWTQDEAYEAGVQLHTPYEADMRVVNTARPARRRKK